MSSGNQRYIETEGSHFITMDDDYINVLTSVGEITLVFPNIRDSGAIPTNKVWFINDVDDMAEKHNVTIVASETTPATELNGNESVVLNTNGFSAEVVPSGYYSYMVNSGVVNSPTSPLPKIYKATLNQTGTDAPVANKWENTFSDTPVWSYEGVGFYKLTLAGEFPSASKILVTFGAGEATTDAETDSMIYFTGSWFWRNENDLHIYIAKLCNDASTNMVYTNGLLTNASIKIEIYP
jgi:hypothetical protein